MSAELKKLRKELEATKSVLHAQAARCRQLVAAFSRKLQEKEKELRASHDLRDRQLACVLRSLLTLESRLRKEQKIIRQQLVEKDKIIAQQNIELEHWRRVSPDVSGEARLDSLCRRPESVETVEYGYRESPVIENAYRDNPVLESVQQILLKDEEDLLTVKPVDSGDKRNVEVGVAWYETDSSLLGSEHRQSENHPGEPSSWCNEEDKVVLVPELNGSSVWSSPENCVLPHPRDKESSGAWCIKVIEAGEEPPVSGGHERLWVKDKTSPPTKAQHMEEKACLQMAKKTLTIAFPKNLEEIEANSITVSESSYQELTPVSSKIMYQKSPSPQKPPALPPKPYRLLKPSEILKNSQTFKGASKPDTLTKPRVHMQEIKRKQMNGHVPGNVKPQAPFVAGTKTEQAESNGVARLKVAMENNIAVEAQKTNGFRSMPKVELEDAMAGQVGHRQSSEVRLQDQIDKLHPAGRPDPPNGLTKSTRLDPSNRINTHESSQLLPPVRIDQQESPRKQSQDPLNSLRPTSHQETPETLKKITRLETEVPIRMCSSVSSLITGATRESIVTELTTLLDQSETDANFNEHLDQADESEDPLQENFEEFKLEECYVESVNEGDGRPEADGAETRCVVSHYAVLPPPAPPDPPSATADSARTYETFLETTGLSQKSILTPSRMLSNHRSCLKPKDVKHRSRVKAAAVGLGPTVKYWTEPFL